MDPIIQIAQNTASFRTIGWEIGIQGILWIIMAFVIQQLSKRTVAVG